MIQPSRKILRCVDLKDKVVVFVFSNFMERDEVYACNIRYTLK